MPPLCSFFFFFNDTATTEIYTLSLHDALPIFRGSWGVGPKNTRPGARRKKLEYSWWARPAKSHLLTQPPAASGKDSYGLSVCFAEMASVGSSHNRSNNKLSATFQMSRQQGLRLHS